MNKHLSQKFRVISLLLMLMVVFLHSYNIDTKQGGVILQLPKDLNWFIQNYISYGITRIAVPLFFMISGFFFVFDQKNSFTHITLKIRKRMRTLVIPYLFWALFGILIYFALQSVPQSQQFFTKQLIRDYTFGQWLHAVFIAPIPYQLWFLKDLIVLVLLSPVIYSLLQKLRLLMILIIVPFWIMGEDTVFLTSEALLYFTAGLYMATKFPQVVSMAATKANLLLLSWLLILFLKVLAGFYEATLIELLLLKMSIILGIPAFWLSYDLWTTDKVRDALAKWAKYSFFIYVFHEPLLTILKKALFVPFPKVPSSYLAIYFISPIIAISISIMAAFLCSKFFTRFYNVITGNR